MLRWNAFGVKKPGEENNIKSKAWTKTGFSFGNQILFVTQTGNLLWGNFHCQFSVEMLPGRFKILRTFQGIVVLEVLM